MTEINPKNKKYSKMLNNLLDIKDTDTTILVKINNLDSFDVISKFSSTAAETILQNKEFNFELEEKDLHQLVKELKQVTGYFEVVGLFDKYKEYLSEYDRLLLQKNKNYLKTLIEKLETKVQQTGKRWNSYIKKIMDIRERENIEPLYIATGFITVKTVYNAVYAPLLLKTVNINLVGSKIRINNTSDSFIINEKALFLLNKSGFHLNENINLNGLNLEQCLNLLSKELNLEIKKQMLLNEFQNLLPSTINNKNIIVQPGIVLGVFRPSGNFLRKKMMEIIENYEIENIINIDPNKQNLHNKMIGFIKNHSHSIVKIQSSNYSQDKALSSALMQDTVIWGPPGTGKSQVIANVIANILYNDKTAIVMSQKRAALDVLRDRLLGLESFVFFILNDIKMPKTDFYKPLKKFINYIEKGGVNRQIANNKLISNAELEALNIIAEFKKSSKYQNTLAAVEFLKDFDDFFIHKCFSLNLNLKYPTEIIDDQNAFLKKLAILNNITKSSLLFVKYWPKEFHEAGLLAWELALTHKIDLNHLRELVAKTTWQDYQELQSIPSKLVSKNKYISNEKYLIEILSCKILQKIEQWKRNDPDKMKKYNAFYAAIKAGREIPYYFWKHHYTIIKEFFPVIITTPESHFIKWNRDTFDYAIVDEASQIHLEVGLSILYLGKIKIFAGDSQQMRPTSWFTIRDVGDNVEEDVVENSDSLLDYALEKGVHQIMLNQNYRSSSAALMAFSSKEFYNSQLEVIDNKKTVKKLPIVTFNVEGKWNNGVNVVEINKMIETAEKVIDKFKTIILLTFNYNQKWLLEKTIMSKHPILAKAIEEEQIMLKNIENIQGDEADLVIISVVYDKTTGMGYSYVARPGGKNALNVAISRAREKMIVIKSVKASELRSANTEDFIVFQKWLAFLDLPQEDQKTYSTTNFQLEESPGAVDSYFEQDVINYLKTHITTTKPVKIIKQYPVGSKRIDIALTDEESNYLLGIEVDGYKYHEGQGFDKYLDDLSRQNFLQNKGYDIFRIKEIDWKINKMEQLKNLEIIINDKLNV
ncbi:AAA domain-containing protein [Spiroplasma endosymbiont of Amphibalanus improvisus]|uniref:AAA domain-containing protein n=1 Tax=Spiroplasma endosymbiont of Amphibalanus improvisus TaxID=3066327 RepID=UPI00313A9B0E